MALRDFLLNTDYPTDKIVWLYSNTVTIAGYDYNDTIAAHGLPFTPLILGQWTTDPTWAICYEMNSGPLGGSPFTVSTSIEAGATNYTFRCSNNTPSGVTLYYRLYAFQPTDSDAAVPHTSNQADKFVLNTDYNYTKLVTSGVTDASTTAATYTITHGLGYRPQVLVWEEQNGIIYPITYYQTGDSAKAIVGTSTVQMTTNPYSSLSRRLHYRIYADD